MKRATEQWMESAEMDINSIEHIIHREDLTPNCGFSFTAMCGEMF